MPPDTPITSMTDTELCTALALAQGYTHVGPFHGQDLWHPPGSRTQVVPLPRPTDDFNVCMPLALQWIYNVPDGAAALRRALCELALTAMQKEEIPRLKPRPPIDWVERRGTLEDT